MRRHATEISGGDLEVEILPLRKDAPIYMAAEARPDFGSSSLAGLERVEILPRYHLELTASRTNYSANSDVQPGK